MKEILLNNQLNNLVYEQDGIIVNEIGKGIYDVYIDGTKINGHVLFPVEQETGCQGCIYSERSVCLLHELYKICCYDILFFGNRNIMSFVKE